METPETEQPPSLPQLEAPEGHVGIIIDSTDPEVPKILVNEEKSNAMDNGGLPTPTPAASSAAIPVPTPRSGPNGSLSTGTPERSSTGGNAETASPYINGGIINKRYSYSGSMASESMDMSIHKESISMSARVSQHEAKISLLIAIHTVGYTFHSYYLVSTLICPI